MEWDNKRKSPVSAREVGLGLLFAGILTLTSGVVLTFTLGTILAFMLLVGSVVLNTAAIVCLRSGKRGGKGDRS